MRMYKALARTIQDLSTTLSTGPRPSQRAEDRRTFVADSLSIGILVLRK